MNAIRTTKSNLVIDSDGVLHIAIAGQLVAIPTDEGESLVSVLPGALALARKLGTGAAPQVEDVDRGSIPEIGAPLAGGFVTGYHPIHRNAVLITGTKSMEGKNLSWQAAQDHCAEQGEGWKAPDRLEALLQFLNLAQCNAKAAAFQKGGAEAFEEEAYWTSEESQFGSDGAWYQYFGNGLAYDWYKPGGLRVRPVRILFI